MIVVTRLNDSQFAINPDLIERIHSSPDTTIVLVDGSKYIVTESLPEVIERIAAYRARVLSLAQEIPMTRSGIRQLELVTSGDHDSRDDPHPDDDDDAGARAVPMLPRRT
ncbi:flagellar FlbD family protein [Leifsonia sp. YIM 134122]|uniref:Flagellar FlbD family protein n=1 Tax=Leifsonia stereocauli TaxID=3134136 RepID=A0ABU9W2I2_9MICO